MRRDIVILICAVAALVQVAAAHAADMAGTYNGHQITITLTGGPDDYNGTIIMEGSNLPLKGTVREGVLRGTFDAEGDRFEFTARLQGTMLSFDTEDTTYILERQGGAPASKNPLARGKGEEPKPRNPLDRGAGAAEPKGTPASGESVKFTKISVKDPGINNIEAVSFLIPAGWQTEGGVQWFPDYSILANLLMRVSDPQSGATIEFLPLQNFTHIPQPVVPMQPGTNYMGNIVWQPIESIPEFVQTFYVPQSLRHLQGARVMGEEDLPRVAAEVARMYGGQSSVKCGRVRYAFQANGQPWEEDVYVTLVYTPWQMGTLWSVSSAYSFRAPQGTLDKMTPLMRTSVSTMRMNLDWFAGYQYVQKLFSERMNQGIRNAAAISETITRNSEEIRRMYSESYQQACASQDRISDSFSEYIRGVDTYKNPYEDRPIQLPAGYRDAWVNAKGEYILSNQSGFDPNVGDTSEWRRMDRRGE